MQTNKWLIFGTCAIISPEQIRIVAFGSILCIVNHGQWLCMYAYTIAMYNLGAWTRNMKTILS